MDDKTINVIKDGWTKVDNLEVGKPYSIRARNKSSFFVLQTAASNPSSDDDNYSVFTESCVVFLSTGQNVYVKSDVDNGELLTVSETFFNKASGVSIAPNTGGGSGSTITSINKHAILVTKQQTIGGVDVHTMGGVQFPITVDSGDEILINFNEGELELVTSVLSSEESVKTEVPESVYDAARSDRGMWNSDVYGVPIIKKANAYLDYEVKIYVTTPDTETTAAVRFHVENHGFFDSDNTALNTVVFKNQVVILADGATPVNIDLTELEAIYTYISNAPFNEIPNDLYASIVFESVVGKFTIHKIELLAKYSGV